MWVCSGICGLIIDVLHGQIYYVIGHDELCVARKCWFNVTLSSMILVLFRMSIVRSVLRGHQLPVTRNRLSRGLRSCDRSEFPGFISMSILSYLYCYFPS